MSRSDPAAEELEAQRAALRRQQIRDQFQERLQGGAGSPALERARERNEARVTELRAAEQQAVSAIVALANSPTANEAEAAVQARSAVQTKEEQRATRESRAAERVQREEELRATSLDVRETRDSARDEEAQARAQREQELEAAIAERREQGRQARAARADERTRAEEPAPRSKRVLEDEAAQQGRARRGAADEGPEASREASTPQTAGRADRESRAAIIARQQQEQAAAEAVQRRQQEEARAAERRQLRAQRQAEEPADAQRAAAAKTRPRQREVERREIERQAELATLADAETSTVSAPRIASGPTLAPRSLAGAGSTARAAVTAGISTSAEQVTDTVPYLQTQGSFIVDENGDAVNLRGVTVRGLDSVAPQAGQAFPTALGLDAQNLSAITGQWGANIVRLPFTATTILSGNGSLAANALLAGLDQTVAAITQAGAYVLLALEAAAGETPTDANTVQVWTTLAARYQAEPRVCYEVFFSAATLAGSATAQLGSLTAVVARQNPGALIFVSAGSGGIDVSGVPLLAAPGVPVPNIVYTIAVLSQNTANTDALSMTTAVYPLFASVWSDDGSDVGRMASHIAEVLERYGIGWAAANWNADPQLVADAAGHDFTPTVWGNVAQGAIKLTTPPLLEPADAPAPLSALSTEGPALPRLKTSGNFILNDAGVAIALRGVTVTGLDTAAPMSGQTVPDALGIDENNLALITGTWGLNLVRLPFQAQTLLSGTSALPAGNVLAGLDLAIALITNAGAYVLLALEAPGGAASPAGPDVTASQVWQVLAQRYKDQPGVLYELFAAPGPLAANWLQSAASLLGTIRAQNSAAMIFVNTGNNGTDFTGLPLCFPTGAPIFNVVYTVNISPQNPPGPDGGPMGSFADANPVFASTWSDDAGNPSRLSPYLGDFFGRHSIGFAAANWNADPRLVTDAINHDFTTTAWGLIAGRAATLPVQQRLTPFSEY
jgi:hypothetical protein